MKKTSKEFMEWLGLKVGDRVEVEQGTIKATFEVRKDFTLLRLDHTPKYNEDYNLWDILGLEYNILPSPKRVGDRICDQFCAGCPLVVLQCFSEEKEKKSLFLVLDETLNRHTDQEIYDLLKARLDKEVEE